MNRHSTRSDASDEALLSQSIPSIASFLAAVFLVLAGAHQSVLAAEQANVMTACALLSASVLLAIAWRANKVRSKRWANRYAIAIGFIALFNSAVHLAVVRESQHSINLLVLALFAGFFISETRSLVVLTLSCFLAWLGISVTYIPSTNWVHFGFAWFIVSSLSMIAHIVRASSRRHMQNLIASHREIQQRLEQSLHEAGRKISERRIAERNLRTSQARKAAILEAASDAIIEVDSEGRITESNQVTTSLLGYHSDEMVGEPLADLIIPEHLRRRHNASFAAYIKTRDPNILGRRLKLSALHKDGTEIPVEVTVQAVDVPGEPVLFAGFIRDRRDQLSAEIAQREAKEAAERSSRAKSTLLANVSHELRTPMSAVLGMTELVLQTDLSEPQRHLLSRSASAADSLLWMVDELLDLAKIESGHDEVHHDEFDLINIIERTVASLALGAESKGLRLEFMLSPGLPSRVFGDAMRLRQVLSNLVGNAIKFTHSGWVRVYVDVLENAEDLICLDLRVEDTGPGIEGTDAERVFEAFEQVNPQARDGAQQGVGLGLSIARRWVQQAADRFERSAALEYEHRDGGGSCFSFSWYVKRVHEDFETKSRRNYRAAVIAPRNPSMDSLCCQLETLGVDCDRGDLSDRSIADSCDFAIVEHTAIMSQGSDHANMIDLGLKTALLIPMSQLGTETELPPSIIPCGMPISGRTLLKRIEALLQDDSTPAQESEATIRVLVIDDDESNRVFAAEALRRAGHVVESASTGAEGLSMFGDQEFDLVLADLRMPGMTGIETIVNMRASKPQSHCEFRIMTAYAGEAELGFALKADIATPLKKPLSVSKLKSLAKEIALTEVNHAHDIAVLLDHHFEGDVELFKSVFEALSRSSSQDLAALEAALDRDEIEKSRQLCHKLAGGLGEFSASQSLVALGSLRTLLKRDRFERSSAIKLFREFQLTVAREIDRIEQWIASSPKKR